MRRRGLSEQGNWPADLLMTCILVIVLVYIQASVVGGEASWCRVLPVAASPMRISKEQMVTALPSHLRCIREISKQTSLAACLVEPQRREGSTGWGKVHSVASSSGKS